MASGVEKTLPQINDESDFFTFESRAGERNGVFAGVLVVFQPDGAVFCGGNFHGELLRRIVFPEGPDSLISFPDVDFFIQDDLLLPQISFFPVPQRRGQREIGGSSPEFQFLCLFREVELDGDRKSAVGQDFEDPLPGAKGRLPRAGIPEFPGILLSDAGKFVFLRSRLRTCQSQTDLPFSTAQK
ncbi:MAG: hypothetical protein J5858_14870 [Lentisphaeria bacterium]|nr:hypothetical protein [Lentisphaeria bacterium]